MAKKKHDCAALVSKADIERAVENLFTNSIGQKATRLLLVDDNDSKTQVGSWGQAALVKYLCQLLLEESACE